MKTLIIYSLLLLSLVSCKKSSSGSTPLCDISMNSMSGDYRQVSSITKGSDGEVTDNLQNVNECDKDNMWTFAENGYLYIKDIGVECSPPYNDIQTWSVVDDEMHLTSGTVPIKSFDCKTFVLEGTDQYNGVTYTTTITFTKY